MINISLTEYSKSNYIFLQEMISNQRKCIPCDKKLFVTDMKRILNKIDKSIFTNKCVLYNGYVTNRYNFKKSAYINFYFKKKKKALHRLLYINFKDDITDDEYIKFTCEHSGYCLSLNCMQKFKYKNNVDKDTEENKEIIEKPNYNHLKFNISFN